MLTTAIMTDGPFFETRYHRTPKASPKRTPFTASMKFHNNSGVKTPMSTRSPIRSI